MNAELKRIYAKTAYQETCARILKNHTEIIDKAFHRIHEVIEEGHTAVTFDSRNFKCDFTQEEVNELRYTERYFESLGYDFKIDYNPAGYYVISISWNQKRS